MYICIYIVKKRHTTPQNKIYTIEPRVKGPAKLEEFPEQVKELIGMFGYV